MGDTDDYDYTKNLDDNHDTLDFGKYKGWTPKDVARQNPGYLRWAYHNVPRWVGSSEFIQQMCKDNGWEFKETAIEITPYDVYEDTTAFDNAILDAFGVTPIRAIHTWTDNHNE